MSKSSNGNGIKNVVLALTVTEASRLYETAERGHAQGAFPRSKRDMASYLRAIKKLQAARRLAVVSSDDGEIGIEGFYSKCPNCGRVQEDKGARAVCEDCLYSPMPTMERY